MTFLPTRAGSALEWGKQTPTTPIHFFSLKNSSLYPGGITVASRPLRGRRPNRNKPWRSAILEISQVPSDDTRLFIVKAALG